MNVSDAFCFLNVWFRIRGMLVSGISVQWEQFITRTSSAASGLDQCPHLDQPKNIPVRRILRALGDLRPLRCGHLPVETIEQAIEQLELSSH